jgi:transposase
LLAQRSTRYDDAVCLHDKAEAVWTFIHNLTMLWTTTQQISLEGPQRHQAVFGYWCTLIPLAQYCRIRFYLVSARNHGIRAVDNALTGNPWLHTPATA